MNALSTGAPRPAYAGVLPYPDRPLAYEGSPLVAVDSADEFQWSRELATAQTKVEAARATLVGVQNEPMPTTRDEASWRLASALDDARRAISPYMNHVPGSPGFENNEVPRYLPDGTMHPDDVRRGARMNTVGSVQMHQETVLHRLPKPYVERMNWQGVANSLETSTRFDDLLIWGGATRTGIPDVPAAIRTLDDLDGQFRSLLETPGQPPVLAPGLGSKLAGLPLPVKLAGAAAVAVGVAGAGVAIARD